MTVSHLLSGWTSSTSSSFQGVPDRFGTNIVIYSVTKKASVPIEKATSNQGLLIEFDSPCFERAVLKGPCLKTEGARPSEIDEALVWVEEQHYLFLDSQWHILASGDLLYIAGLIIAVGTEDAVPQDNGAAVIRVALSATQRVVKVMLGCCGKYPVIDGQRLKRQV